ncbi:MAG: VCBS repeat-containing protein [Actinobacteria bacterium]|nr:VCBS repeat-containing protein [Actinomycetota bacterium]
MPCRPARRMALQGCLLALGALALAGCSGGDAGVDPGTATRPTAAATIAAAPTTTGAATTRPTPGGTSTTAPRTEVCLPRWFESSESSIRVDGAVERIATGDFNGDGWTDALVARMVFQSPDSRPIDILLGDGNDLSPATAELFGDDVPGLTHPAAILVEDFNGDGVADVFVADTGMDAPPFPGYQNTLLLSAPGGAIVDATDRLPQQWDQSHFAAAADVDLDGDLDLYVANLGGGGVPPQIWLNDGDGRFTVSDLLPPAQADLTRNWYTSAGFADVDGDADPDLILGHGDPGRDSHVLLNDGSGAFTQHPQDLPPTPLGADDLVLDVDTADLDGDGLDDLILVSTRNDYRGRYIQILIGNGDGTFRDESGQRIDIGAVQDGIWIKGVDLLDLEWDGDLDMVARPLEGQPQFYLNDGTGSFTRWDPGFDLWSFALLDLDGDRNWDALNVVGADPPAVTRETTILVRHAGC